MKITVVTPSIRPEGLEVVHDTLAKQSFRDFEWVQKLSVPGPTSDLCFQMNQALAQAKGELIVFLQDYITIPPNGLERMWEMYVKHPNTCFTAPVGKVTDLSDPYAPVTWDWRRYSQNHQDITYERWEIDWGSAPRIALERAGGFEERYDEGFGWENVDLAYRLQKLGYDFKVDCENAAVAWDHDKFLAHPYKHAPNQDLWTIRKGVIDLNYDQA